MSHAAQDEGNWINGAIATIARTVPERAAHRDQRGAREQPQAILELLPIGRGRRGQSATASRSDYSTGNQALLVMDRI